MKRKPHVKKYIRGPIIPQTQNSISKLMYNIHNVIHVESEPQSIAECKVYANKASIGYYTVLKSRCNYNRRTRDPKDKSNASWDMPAVICSCNTPGRDVIVRDNCRATIKPKNCHPKLKKVLPGPLDSSYPRKGMHIGGRGFKVGHCAEPHAANTLLKITNCNVPEIVFGDSISTGDGSVMAPCLTCKATFKQLR